MANGNGFFTIIAVHSDGLVELGFCLGWLHLGIVFGWSKRPTKEQEGRA